MTEEAYERVARSAVTMMRSLVVPKAIAACGAPESPIEEAMLIGLAWISFIDPDFAFRRSDGALHRWPMVVGDPWFVITLQKKFEQYRVDFAIEIVGPSDKSRWLIVECDGFHFHDRTPDQAARDKARDRFLTGQGHTVIRLAGIPFRQVKDHATGLPR